VVPSGRLRFTLVTIDWPPQGTTEEEAEQVLDKVMIPAGI